MTLPDPSSPSRRLFAGDFPELQAQFIADLREWRQRDPLAPLVVLVPGVLAGLSLRRELARAGVSHANLRFCTLTDYAHDLASPLLVERGWRMISDVERDPLMKRAVEMCSLRYFHRMAPRKGFQRAAWTTIHELKAVGLTAEDILPASDRPQVSDLTRQKLKEIAAIWRALDGLMRRHKLADHAMLIELAGQAAGNVKAGLVVYGLDDLSAMKRQLILRAMAGCETIAYLPFRASDAYVWSEPLYQWYLEQGFEAELLEPDERAGQDNALARVQLGVFEETLEDDPLNPPTEVGGDESFRVISAAGRDSEVEEILREVVYGSASHPKSFGIGPDSPPLSPPRERRGETIGVLMRESASYLPLVREEWSRAGITSYIHECRRLGDTPSGRALRWLVRLFDGVFRRTDVMEFLLSSPLRRPAYFPPELPEVPAAEWNHFTLKAQIIAGETPWRQNLSRLCHQLEEELARREREMDDPAAPLQRQLASLDVFQQYIERLFAGITAVRKAKTWREIGERTAALYVEFVESNGEAELIREQLTHAALLDALGLKPDAAEFSSFIESLLSQPLDREGKFEVHEPTIARISDAFGVVFDDVILCGVVEKEFPRPTAQDPLLLDDERLQLQRALHHPDIAIPLRSRLRHRERFLFRTAVNSARRRVVLTYSRLDPVEGREWLASAFLLRALEAATGNAADYESLESFVRTSPQARRVALNRLQGKRPDQAVTPFQYDLARLGMALHTKSADNVAYLFCADPAFQRGVHAEHMRYRAREFTPFDGSIESQSLRERLKVWIPSLSPRRIQRYLDCPFQYFVMHLLELEPTAEPHWLQPLEPRARGMLIHDILEHFYRAETRANRWPLTADAWPRLASTADESFAEFERKFVPGLPLLWDIEKERIKQRLQAFFSCEVNAASSFRPAHFNVTYGLDEGDSELSRREPVTLPIGNGYTLRLHGRIDRVDIGVDGAVRLVDYTTAKFENRAKQHDTAAGLEPHVARLAAAALGLDVGAFAYYFLGTEEAQTIEISRESWEQNRASITRLIEEVSGLVGHGQFFPTPNDVCQFCAAKAACGTGRFTHKWDYELPQTDALRVLREGSE